MSTSRSARCSRSCGAGWCAASAANMLALHATCPGLASTAGPRSASPPGPSHSVPRTNSCTLVQEYSHTSAIRHMYLYIVQCTLSAPFSAAMRSSAAAASSVRNTPNRRETTAQTTPTAGRSKTTCPPTERPTQNARRSALCRHEAASAPSAYAPCHYCSFVL